eukprot:CAMPEP_0183701868 /NCGR_PEP_ID=MMETSP0737-20130205/104_1 /TAXON_ID=385413 /ORGANISM="Thalassiosira miniscula, Strain CCMP1093" /LENGTH=414 /DNA_ID=CAMNT_0025928361 /DNA_START=176 /DNA_END=1420 /DNA_ORIENTATION=+
MGHKKYTSSDRQVSSSSHLILGTNDIMKKPSKKSARSFKDSIKSIILHLRRVTYEEDYNASGASTTKSTSSADGQSLNDFTGGGHLSRHEKESPLLQLTPERPSIYQSTPPLSYQHDQRSFSETYQILPQIKGTGVAGEVRQCFHLPTFQACAVKTISIWRMKGRKDRVRREIALLKEVNHPNIISLYDVFEETNNVHIVTELCRGGELFDKIIQKAALNKTNGDHAGQDEVPACFDEKDAARIILSLLSAVSYLHSKDIVHRDIKPENILFAEAENEESQIKLIDFGLSTRHPPQCKPLTAVVGTSYYMAPELLRGSYGRSCDIWSVGVVAYTMLFGRPPFNGQTNDIIFEKIRRGEFNLEHSSLWNGVGRDAKDFIRCLLVMDPTKRWTADMALEHPWLKTVRRLKKDVARS